MAEPREKAGRVLVVIPVFGEQETTHALLDDLRREADHADVVVDNRGDYEAAGDETVLRPGSNLGWAGGTNHGTATARRDEHVAFVWLNNDTRLSSTSTPSPTMPTRPSNGATGTRPTPFPACSCAAGSASTATTTWTRPSPGPCCWPSDFSPTIAASPYPPP